MKPTLALLALLLAAWTAYAALTATPTHDLGNGARSPSAALPANAWAATPSTTTTTTEAHRHDEPKTVRAQSVGSASPYPTDELLDALASCETGGTMDPTVHGGTGGKYHGAFQFLLSTWASIGGTGDPHTQPYEVQREFARALVLRSGWAQFPFCSRQIGAR